MSTFLDGIEVKLALWKSPYYFPVIFNDIGSPTSKGLNNSDTTGYQRILAEGVVFFIGLNHKGLKSRQ